MQLPVLKDLQRVIDELAFGVGAPSSQAAPGSHLIVEQVRLHKEWDVAVSLQQHVKALRPLPFVCYVFQDSGKQPCQ
jgi:hypothetical protein